MAIWDKYDSSERDEYINFLRLYAALSKMFNQKSSETGAPYLDSKFQETIYARSFHSEDVDIGNTPHDIRSVFNKNSNDPLRIGIGIKTWLNSRPSYQKVMQLKSFRDEINPLIDNSTKEDLANKLAEIKNSKLLTDYARLGLSEDQNIYHYVTRDSGRLLIQETSYPLIDVNTLEPLELTNTSFTFKDRYKQYKYTFGDSQIWMRFGDDQTILDEERVDILDDPFDFLKNAFKNDKGIITLNRKSNVHSDETYLPLYSYRSKKVSEKSGINAFNGASKNKDSESARPEGEAYIPIPKDYWKKNPNWFNKQIDFRNQKKYKQEYKTGAYTFNLHLPNGKVYGARITQDGFKSLQTDPQSALGKWLLYDVLRLQVGQIVTMDTLKKAGYDSVRLWHEYPNDYKEVWIDFAPFGSFERYMNDELTDNTVDTSE
ncbi:NgoFVII family restriction endonuclease [Lactobacillaceae bacterium Melli_B4]